MGKKLLCILLCAVLLSALCPVYAAESGEERTVIGADLNDEQINAVYSTFGIPRGSVKELTVTNAEERALLSGLVDESVIGSRSISCVYIRLLSEGESYSISVSNIDWCSAEMYRNALLTAGIQDVKVIVTAPFSVSGTAALAGIYKAYEDITGKKLNETAKEVGTQELVTTGELADTIGSADATEIVNELKLILNETAGMSDEELAERIREIAGHYGVTLTDEQIAQLISLCRQMEKLSDTELTNRVRQLQEKLKGLGELQEKAGEALSRLDGFREKLASVLEILKGFFLSIIEYIRGLVNSRS